MSQMSILTGEFTVTRSCRTRLEQMGMGSSKYSRKIHIALLDFATAGECNEFNRFRDFIPITTLEIESLQRITQENFVTTNGVKHQESRH